MARTYTFKELKESRLLYDRKPPMFGLIMTFLTLAFVVAALVWAALSAITYVVKATGLVADEKKTNIMNAVGGEVESISVVEGQAVKVGDTILTIDSYQVRLQIAQLQAMVDMYGDRIVHLSAGLTQGTVLSAGTLLGSIVSGEQANLYIDTVVSATERSKLTVGSAVEIAVSGAA